METIYFHKTNAKLKTCFLMFLLFMFCTDQTGALILPPRPPHTHTHTDTHYPQGKPLQDVTGIFVWHTISSKPQRKLH